MSETKPYGSWPSPVSAASLVAGMVGFAELRSNGSTLFWLEARPQEAGRSVLVGWNGGSKSDLTPAPHNVRSRVHEYGGGAYAVTGTAVYFVDFVDQNLHAIDLASGVIEQLTAGDASVRFADFVVDPAGNRLISVVEDHRAEGEPENYLAAVVDLDSGTVTPLHQGHDFYAAPRLAADGKRLAFTAWDHPNMPWDGTSLIVAGIDAKGCLINAATVAGGSRESVVQPRWQDDALLFFSDINGFWNLYRYDASGVYCVLEDGAEYARPAWVFGVEDCALMSADHVVLNRQTDDGAELVLVNTATTLASPLIEDCAFYTLCAHQGELVFVAGHRDRSPTIERLNLEDRSRGFVATAGSQPLEQATVALGQPIAYPTRDGDRAHAYFYPPTSADCVGPADERPPLVVMSHGGPTAATDATMSLKIQYFTSRGWAVLDVNYRGSSGYGRAYRAALDGRWGELDVCDCEDGVRWLAAEKLIDPERVAIRGGSAGGYTTLVALTTTRTFQAGASYYGVADLNALARDTHKFESRYLDGLLGSEAALTTRSPINQLEGLRCPVIFFQGADDRVVPPNQSQAMAAALRARGIPVAYLEFEGEGHGFRRAENIIRATEMEYGFLCRVFDIEPGELLPVVPIENAENLKRP